MLNYTNVPMPINSVNKMQKLSFFGHYSTQ
uniref:Uncharacterized protein n=1 Tax=Rhizophora mucronata TaxID=61149 RepID=A0A2P2N8M2_RHIMU